MKELKDALEALVLFTKPSKFNAAALHNAHRVLAECASSENEQLRAQVEELKENCSNYLHEVEELKAKLETAELLGGVHCTAHVDYDPKSPIRPDPVDVLPDDQQELPAMPDPQWRMGKPKRRTAPDPAPE